MTARSKDSSTQPTSRGDLRRASILKALHECIIEQGYAKTTLRDIAKKADLYPSHVLYYYDGKEAILRQFFIQMSEFIVGTLEGYVAESPERQIDLLVDLFFSGKSIHKSEIGLMLECFGVAVNDVSLKKEKTKVDKATKSYLAKLFKKTPLWSDSNHKDSAEIAYSLLIGLRTAVYFDGSLKLSRAQKIFRDTMLHIAGFKDS